MTVRLTIGGLMAAIGLLGGSAAVASSPTAGATSTSGITVLLRAPHPHQLAALARARSLTHAQRVSRLKHLVPTGYSVAAVKRTLAGEGLSVADRTAWTITASGSTTELSAAHLLTHAPVLSVVPAVLSPYVSAVLPTVSTEPAFHHTAALPVDGTGFRNAYTSKMTAPPGSSTKPSTSTVATLQLAGFASSDLSTYAKKVGLPNIVGTPRYRPVTVDDGSGSASSSQGGDVEVALDQESILATAPGVKQRPYFAPNSGGGFVDVFANVFDDVVQNKHANRGGDPHIVALSSSWGGCESNTGAAQIRADQTVIKALVAAGVTIFASSGDDGIYDCRDSTGTGLGNSASGVDYPASSPQVVGVGGTNLSYRGKASKPNNGHNWRETAWSCRSPSSCEGNGLLPILPNGTGGSGGGESGLGGGLFSGSSFKGFPAPGYQKRYVKGSTFGHQKYRMVPDISADGDPQTGFKLYSSDSEVASAKDANGLVQVGGTSLSSPISAALLTNALVGIGVHHGVGDIHVALYRAARHRHGVFRDITKGTNGAAADRGRDPSVTAHRGYDTITGLGSVLWPAFVSQLRGHLSSTDEAS